MPEPTKTLFDKLKRGLFMTHTEIIEKVKESLAQAGEVVSLAARIGDRERASLARELHDSTAQRLAALERQLGRARSAGAPADQPQEGFFGGGGSRMLRGKKRACARDPLDRPGRSRRTPSGAARGPGATDDGGCGCRVDSGEHGKRAIALVDRAEYKRRQAPPGVKISSRAFGRDRRYPITNGFKAKA